MTNFQFSLRKSSGSRTPDLSKSSSKFLLSVSKSSPRSFPKADLGLSKASVRTLPKIEPGVSKASPRDPPKVDIRSSEHHTNPKADLRSSEQLKNRSKISPGKLPQKHSSVKTETQRTNENLGKSADQIRVLEVKIEQLTLENSKLRARHREDSTSWKELESRMSSTEKMCNHLNETLQRLTSQVDEMEVGKNMLEEKLLEQMASYEESVLKVQFLNSKLEATESNLLQREQEFKVLSTEKEELEESYEAEVSKTKILTVTKENIEKQLQETLKEKSRALGSLQGRISELQRELAQKRKKCNSLEEMQLKLEKDKQQHDIQIQDYEKKLSALDYEKNSLKAEILQILNNFMDLEKLSLMTSNNMEKLLSKIDRNNELVQQEILLANTQAEAKIEHLKTLLEHAVSTNKSLELKVEESRKGIIDLNQTLETVERIHAQNEADATLELSKTKQSLHDALEEADKKEVILRNLQENVSLLFGNINQIRKDKENLLLAIRNLKEENQMISDNCQDLLCQKVESLLTKIADSQHAIQTQASEVNHLHSELSKKTQLIMELTEREKSLVERNAEVNAELIASQQNVSEIKRQCELQIEAKQMELTKHLKEISLRNDQEISDIRRRCEAETRESINKEKEREKEKAAAMLDEAKRKFEEKINEVKEDSFRSLKQANLEHELEINQLHEMFDKEKLMLKDSYNKELKRNVEEYDMQFNEKSAKLTREAEGKMATLKLNHQEELQKLQEERNRQCLQAGARQESLEFQIKMLKEQLQDEFKRRENDLAVILQKGAGSSNKEGACESNQGNQISTYGKQPSVDKVCEQAKAEAFARFPKQRRKITQHEVEVATSDGKKTITKRRSTRSTVMFGGEADTGTISDAALRQKGSRKKRLKPSRTCPSPMGELFGGRSLDPYAEDPYAFG